MGNNIFKTETPVIRSEIPMSDTIPTVKRANTNVKKEKYSVRILPLSIVRLYGRGVRIHNKPLRINDSVLLGSHNILNSNPPIIPKKNGCIDNWNCTKRIRDEHQKIDYLSLTDLIITKVGEYKWDENRVYIRIKKSENRE